MTGYNFILNGHNSGEFIKRFNRLLNKIGMFTSVGDYWGNIEGRTMQIVKIIRYI